jgi:glycosyltransferase involved in cell wall biosynthesis
LSRPIRLVQVSAFPVLPAEAGGKIRIVKLARALCELGVEVTIIAPYHVTQKRSLAKREPFKLLEVPYPFLIPLLFTDRPIPYGALVSIHPGYRTLLPKPLESFDVCQLEHPAFVDLVRRMPASVPVVYDAQNVEFDYVRAESRSKAVRSLAGDRVRSLEAELMRRAAHVFACSNHDLNRLMNLYGKPRGTTSVLPNGIDVHPSVDFASWRTPPRPPRRAIFSGSGVIHNCDAANSILSRVAPALEDEVEFVILGACARKLRRPRSRNVILDPSGCVSQYAGPETVGLNPVQLGSGTSLKLLHYLAHGLPVLSTPFGLRGLEELAPWVEVAGLDAFPDALRRGIRLPEGVREKLAPYQWRVIAEDALKVYEGLSYRDDAGTHAHTAGGRSLGR